MNRTATAPLIANLPRRWLQAALLLLISSLLPGAVYAAAPAAKPLDNKTVQLPGTGSIAVLYPDISEPYRSVFTQIIAGIQERTHGRVNEFAVQANADATELNANLRRKDTKVIIALGRQAARLTTALDNSFRVVVGGVLTTQESRPRNLQVNVLCPDPALLFLRIKELMPKVRRIYTVYDPRVNSWLVRLAREAARAQNIELIAIEALDLRGAMTAYSKIMTESDNSRDALWLPQDPTTVEEGTVLPMVLQESWNRNLAVFSSNPGHVRQGVLFSLYPDNVELGRHLAESALAFLGNDSNDTDSLLPLREVLVSVNLRTAKHLGLNIGRAQHFDMVYPER
ncbi:MAG: ABC transporter substrate binding protein [Gallionella sp.]|nr:ABC transporter substrate binding protein [Gallionella sp.]MDD4947427.1 ABC transporter substrate binding protein [Gallionella sp.]